jgi:hypothetical protein
MKDPSDEDKLKIYCGNEVDEDYLEDVINISRFGLFDHRIRKYWFLYKDLVEYKLYKEIFNSWAEKFHVKINEPNAILLRKFLCREIKENNKIALNDNEMKLYSFTPKDRHMIHRLCDNLGLHHQTVDDILYVYIPDDWSWEYSKPNPYPINPRTLDYEIRHADYLIERKKWL